MPRSCRARTATGCVHNVQSRTRLPRYTSCPVTRGSWRSVPVGGARHVVLAAITFREREATMWTGTLRRAAALLGALFLAGACTEGSSNAPITSPSFAASSSSLPHINNTSLPIPVDISADFSAYDCSNNPGPQITFSGGSFLGGYGVEMTFTNNMKGTHTYTDGHTVNVTVMPADEQIVIPKQPVLGGAGGNPFIWVQFVGANGAALSDEIFVGRCVQGAGWHVTHSAVTTAAAVATFTVEGCENS